MSWDQCSNIQYMRSSYQLPPPLKLFQVQWIKNLHKMRCYNFIFSSVRQNQTKQKTLTYSYF